jgi:CHAD domain-containing protein
MALEPESKSARGHRLLTCSQPTTSKAVRPAITADMQAGMALRLIVGGCIGHLMANVPAVRDGAEEGIHQARIAVRRLRSAFRLFRPVLHEDRVGMLDAELQRFGRVLGQARDWDVLIGHALPRISAEGDAPWVPPLQSAAAMEQAAAHAALTQALHSVSFTRLVLALEVWAGEALARPADDMAKPIGDVAPMLLERLAKTVRKRGRRLDRATPDQRHALRKSLKKLRYGVSFMQDVVDHDHARRVLKRAKAVLDVLGAMNDATVAVEVTKPFRLQPALEAAVDSLAAKSRHWEAEGTSRLPELWKRFSDARTPWR